MTADPVETAAPMDGATDGALHRQGTLGGSLERLRALLLAEGGLMASLVAEPHTEVSISHTPPLGPAQLAASGPRATGHGADYELLMETIYEGYLLHYGASRVVRPSEEDLGLLAGDRLYALGLARLVELGDIEAVAELADVITLSALARAGATPELAEAVWMAGAQTVGWGAGAGYEEAKDLLRVGSPEALQALRRLGPARDTS
ncbi:MAG: hypothetical protein WB998_00340 [Solirubrobacteraceae bacterium]